MTLSTRGGIVDVTDETFTETVLLSELPVLVDFWADWCPPCHRMAPVLEDIAVELAGRLVVVKLNADDNPNAPRDYGVMAMPTFAVFRGGEMVASFVGARSKTKFVKELDNVL